MSSSTNSIDSTEPPTQLNPNLAPVPLKYVPISAPLLEISSNAITITVSEGLGAPCRRCLLDASPGEKVHLISYDPFPINSSTPYRGKGPIFIHASHCETFQGSVLPERQLQRLLSVRAFDEGNMMVGQEVVDGKDFEQVVGTMLADERARYVNVYNAKPGCFAVRVERA